MKKIFGILTLTALVSVASATNYTKTLTNDNSVVKINTFGDDYVFDWKVDGVDQLYKEQFFIRLDNCKEYALTYGSANQNGNQLVLTYRLDDVLEAKVTYVLDGGAPGSGQSALHETVEIKNLMCQSALDVHLFEYTDLDLNANANDDWVTIQVGPGGSNAIQIDQEGSLFSETVGDPDRVEAGFSSGSNNIYSRLTDNDADNLSNNLAAGPGDVVWAFQWDFNIPAGQSVEISNTKRIDKAAEQEAIPEPLTLLGLVMGVGGLAGYLRKRRTA